MNNNKSESLQTYIERSMTGNTAQVTAIQAINEQDLTPVIEFEYDPIAKQFVDELFKRDGNKSSISREAMLIAIDEVVSELDTSSVDFPTSLASVLMSQQKIRITDAFANKYTGGNKIADPLFSSYDVVWLRNTLELILGRKMPSSWNLVEPGFQESSQDDSDDGSDYEDDEEYEEANNWDEEDDLDDDVEEDADYIP